MKIQVYKDVAEVKAKEVKVVDWMKTFIHRPHDGSSGWIISEYTTGLMVFMGKTKAQAIENTKDRLDGVDEISTLNYIKSLTAINV